MKSNVSQLPPSTCYGTKNLKHFEDYSSNHDIHWIIKSRIYLQKYDMSQRSRPTLVLFNFIHHKKQDIVLFFLRSGGALPRDILGSASVQVGSSFIMVGGKCGSCDPPFVNSMVEWDPIAEEWFDRPETITTGRFRHSGMLVSDHTITCSKRKRFFQGNKYGA